MDIWPQLFFSRFVFGTTAGLSTSSRRARLPSPFKRARLFGTIVNWMINGMFFATGLVLADFFRIL